jgi:hypothetical protein
MRRPAAKATQTTAPAPRRGRPPKATSHFPPAIEAPKCAEVAVTVDGAMRRMIDEYGELDRKMQLLSPDCARYDVLKRAIKSWFDGAPADADGIVEGRVYRLHLSARERERRVRSMRDLVGVIGLDKFLELASVPIGALEDLLGKTRAASLVTEARTGSRRIKAVPKRAVGKD